MPRDFVDERFADSDVLIGATSSARTGNTLPTTKNLASDPEYDELIR